ncbi:MAG: hypothetical protein JXA71_03320 [Chitinispirillaceae bacterium]|nr:hypothetical protein [Chitinispirillaceae bacterium]
MSQNQVHEKIRSVIFETRRDTRYKIDAYFFVMSGLEFYLTLLGEKRHVTGQELSKGLLNFAHKQFGPLARSVLRHWGINTTDDLGNIVYNLISIRMMSKQPQDRIEDFNGVVDLDDFFASQDCFEIDRNFIKSIKGA